MYQHSHDAINFCLQYHCNNVAFTSSSQDDMGNACIDQYVKKNGIAWHTRYPNVNRDDMSSIIRNYCGADGKNLPGSGYPSASAPGANDPRCEGLRLNPDPDNAMEMTMAGMNEAACRR